MYVILTAVIFCFGTRTLHMIKEIVDRPMNAGMLTSALPKNLSERGRDLRGKYVAYLIRNPRSRDNLNNK